MRWSFHNSVIEGENYTSPILRCFSSWNLHQNSWKKWVRKLKRISTRKRQALFFVNNNKNNSEIGKWSITSNSGETEKMLGWGGCRKGAYLCGKCNQVLTSKYENLTDGLDDDKCIDFLMFQKEEWIAELSTNVGQSWCHCKQSADCSDHEGMLS